MVDLLLLFGAVFVVSLISLVGAFSLSFKKGILDKLLFGFVSFSAGSLLAAGLLDLLPESLKGTSPSVALPVVILGVIVFFVLEKFVFWSYHKHKYKVRTFAYMNLIGDGLHNLLDGIAMAASFIISTPLGIVTTLAVIFHEIPQEMGDFGVLVYGGFKPMKALFYNFLTALTAFAGAIIGLVAASTIAGATPAMLALSAGGFLYIACTDMLPELHKEHDTGKSIIQLILLLLGAGLIGTIIYFT